MVGYYFAYPHRKKVNLFEFFLLGVEYERVTKMECRKLRIIIKLDGIRQRNGRSVIAQHSPAPRHLPSCFTQHISFSPEWRIHSFVPAKPMYYPPLTQRANAPIAASSSRTTGFGPVPTSKRRVETSLQSLSTTNATIVYTQRSLNGRKAGIIQSIPIKESNTLV